MIHTVASINKTCFAGEYSWMAAAGNTSPAQGNDSDLASWFRVIEQTPTVIGDTFWSLFGHNVPNCTVSVPSIFLSLPSHPCSAPRPWKPKCSPACRLPRKKGVQKGNNVLANRSRERTSPRPVPPPSSLALPSAYRVLPHLSPSIRSWNPA